MLDSLMLKKVENIVKELFATESTEENIYHSLTHTTEVVDVAEKICIAEEISETDIEAVLIASWFHDIGYFDCCDGHEDKSAEYAREYLEKESYSKINIEKIIGCIKATKVPQKPKNKLEEIVCDADLHHLGLNDIKERGELLRKEFELREIKKLSNIEWLKTSLDFFKTHKFFTRYALREFGSQKNINQRKIELEIEKLERQYPKI